MTPTLIGCLLVAAAVTAVAAIIVVIRRRNMHLWIGGYLLRRPHRIEIRSKSSDEQSSKTAAPTHIFLAICDHYEPEWGRANVATALARVRRWRDEYPRRFEEYRDCDGRPPQHTFFFPQDQYRPEYLDTLTELCDAGFGDVDVHLHHHDDTPEGLHEKLESFRETLFHRHGLLRRDPVTGEIVYGFIHGNWALCNSRPDGQWCGVDEEIDILCETGCYADFTMPSAPCDTQTATSNSIYYAFQESGPKSHDRGQPARVGVAPPDDALLLIQGPLALDWQNRKWGMLPRIENGSLHRGRPATIDRFEQWLQAHVHVCGRPDWVFVKLHAHGAKEANIDMMLGPEMQAFHRALHSWTRQRHDVRFHYVTAWEMAQLVHQAEQGAAEPIRLHAGCSHVVLQA